MSEDITVQSVVLDRLFVRATNETKEPGELVELPAYTTEILAARGTVAILPDKPKRGTVVGEPYPYRYTGKAWVRVVEETPPEETDELAEEPLRESEPTIPQE